VVVRCKQKKAAEGRRLRIWLRTGPESQGVPPLPCLRPYHQI